MKDATTRDERLAWTAEYALSRVVESRGGEAATVALAMVEQLMAAGAPIDALELSIVYWSRALDGLSPGVIPQERLTRLDADLAIERAASPVLARWVDAMRSRVRRAEDLDAMIRLLMQARMTWLSLAAVGGH